MGRRRTIWKSIRQLRLIFSVVAKMVQPVRDVILSFQGLVVLKIAFLHPHGRVAPQINVTMLDRVPLKSVAVPLPIAVWVARLGLGLAVSNTLIGDTR